MQGAAAATVTWEEGLSRQPRMHSKPTSGASVTTDLAQEPARAVGRGGGRGGSGGGSRVQLLQKPACANSQLNWNTPVPLHTGDPALEAPGALPSPQYPQACLALEGSSAPCSRAYLVLALSSAAWAPSRRHRMSASPSRDLRNMLVFGAVYRDSLGLSAVC